MTISESFVKLLEDKGFGIFGQNLFLYRVPNSLKTRTELYWVIPTGGSPIRHNATGERTKSYQFMIYYRSNSAEKVDKVLHGAEALINCAGCVQLDGFEVVEVQATQLPVDQDLDSENRMIGAIQVQLQVYAKC